MKFLLLLLLVASLLTVDSPFTNEVREKLIGFISNKAQSEYSENRITDKVSAEIRSYFNRFNAEEERFITEYLDDPKQLVKLHKNYCEHDMFYSEMSDINRRAVCKIIDSELEAIEAESLRN